MEEGFQRITGTLFIVGGQVLSFPLGLSLIHFMLFSSSTHYWFSWSPSSAERAPPAPLARITPYRILACLPAQSSPILSSDLREAIAQWEIMKKNKTKDGMSFYNTKYQSIVSSIVSSFPDAAGGSASSVAGTKLLVDGSRLFLSLLSLNDDTERILPSFCDALEIHNPSLLVSFLDPKATYYAKVIAEQSSLPFITVTGEYSHPTHNQFLDEVNS